MPHTASDLFVERLTEWDVDTIFGLPGDGINGFVEALRKRQEQAPVPTTTQAPEPTERSCPR